MLIIYVMFFLLLKKPFVGEKKVPPQSFKANMKNISTAVLIYMKIFFSDQRKSIWAKKGNCYFCVMKPDQAKPSFALLNKPITSKSPQKRPNLRFWVVFRSERAVLTIFPPYIMPNGTYERIKKFSDTLPLNNGSTVPSVMLMQYKCLCSEDR